jgi:hypothetical protein
MKILKNLLAFAIILLMFGQTTINSFAKIINDPVVNFHKEQLLQIKWWDKLIIKIDKFIWKISDKKLILLEEKIKKAKTKIYSNSDDVLIWSKEDKFLLIIWYIEAKINEKKEFKVVMWNTDEWLKDFAENSELKFENTLSEIDNKKVNTQLIKIQKSLLEQWVDNFEKVLWELEKYTNYEEKGNFNLNLDVNHKTLWKSKVKVKLEDYIYKNYNFDTQFKSKVEAIFEATQNWKEEIKMTFSAFIDYIIKDQNYYVLLKNLNIKNNEQNQEIKVFIEKAKQLASKNKYIQIEDKNAKKIINQIVQFTPQNILKQGNEIVKKPLFKAYKKEWNKYYLVPSKYGCDTGKKLSQTFDPFNGNTCTDNQYKSLLEDINKSKIKIYIDFSNRNTQIGFESDVEDMKELKWEISFSDKYIEEINFSAIPDQKKYPNESASLNYKRNKILDAKFYANKWLLSLSLKSSLDKNNNFSEIDLKANLSYFVAELKLYNNKIIGKYNLEDWNNKIVWIISWKTNYNNRLNRLNISNQIINLWKYSPFENLTTFEYNNGNSIELNNKYSSEWSKSELNSNIDLKNRKINGSTKFYIKDKEYFTIEHNGKIEKNLFELNNKFELKEEASKMFMKWFDPMLLDSDVKKINMNINLKTDIRWNKNNWYIYIDLNIDTNKVIEIELDNKSTKIYKDIKIQAPSKNNTVPLEESMKNETFY